MVFSRARNARRVFRILPPAPCLLAHLRIPSARRSVEEGLLPECVEPRSGHRPQGIPGLARRKRPGRTGFCNSSGGLPRRWDLFSKTCVLGRPTAENRGSGIRIESLLQRRVLPPRGTQLDPQTGAGVTGGKESPFLPFWFFVVPLYIPRCNFHDRACYPRLSSQQAL